MPRVNGDSVPSMRRSAATPAGQVVEINISPQHEELPRPVENVRAVAGRGLRGDRYFIADGEPVPNRLEDLTLIAIEALEALRDEHGIELSAAESRRNVATRGIDLDALVGKRFRVGSVECEGIMLCEPCNGLAKMTQRGVLKGLAHRGGLNAAIVGDGEIAIGDRIAPAGA
jgi:MOSC domain-containing protein YiiM